MKRLVGLSFALYLSAGTAAISCTPAREPAVGVSDKPRVSPKPKRPENPGLVAPADMRSGTSELSSTRVPSLGHASGRWDFVLSANEAGKAALAPGGDKVAVGAKLVMDHFERGTGEKGPTMAMEKREAGFDPEHGDWRWIVVGSNGKLVFDGKTERCWGCHDDAPKDRVFPKHE